MNAALGIAVPKLWQYEVTGIFNTGMFQYDNQFVVMSLPAAQQFTGMGSAVSGIEIRLRDPDTAPAVGERLVEKLGYPFRFLDWQSQNSGLFSALQLEKIAMGLVIFFIMIVAAFNIVGTLTMVVTDKTREIGILQAMGVTGRSIGKIFLLQGALIGAVGTFLGPRDRAAHRVHRGQVGLRAHRPRPCTSSTACRCTCSCSTCWW